MDIEFTALDPVDVLHDLADQMADKYGMEVDHDSFIEFKRKMQAGRAA